MSAPGPELVLGIDTQPTRLGLGLVCRTTAVPVWAGTFPLRRPPATTYAVARFSFRTVLDLCERRGWYVAELAIERGVVHGTSMDTLYDCGAAYGVCRDAARSVFRETLVRVTDDVRIQSWKHGTVGKGNANKDEVAVWVRAHALAHGWDEVQMNGLAKTDATDALAIGTFIARQRVGETTPA